MDKARHRTLSRPSGGWKPSAFRKGSAKRAQWVEEGTAVLVLFSLGVVVNLIFSTISELALLLSQQ